MSTYNFYLKNSATSGDRWGEGTRYVIGLHLKEFFDEVCQDPGTSFSVSDFWWDPTSITGSDLLIYFVDSQANSLVRKIRPNGLLGSGGTTHISAAGNLSEVYVSAAHEAQDMAKGVAVLAFHEAMHNLLKMGNGLHGSGGMGLAAETVYETSTLTATNRKLMAKALGTNIPQNASFL